MAITEWTESSQFEELVASGGTGFIFKHSTRCNVSADADAEVQRFAANHTEVPVFKVLVVESRPVSNAVAEQSGVSHASPQVILLRDGKPVWNASHWHITEEALAAAWSGDPSSQETPSEGGGYFR